MSDSITITPALVAQWQQQLMKAMADVARLTKQIQAGETLLGLEGSAPSEATPGANGHAPSVAVTPADDNMTAAIEKITKSSRPLTHKEMREKLKVLGFPDERLGNYYYTAVRRLNKKKRIYIGPDNKVGAMIR